jgi:hypothetical protein
LLIDDCRAPGVLQIKKTRHAGDLQKRNPKSLVASIISRSKSEKKFAPGKERMKETHQNKLEEFEAPGLLQVSRLTWCILMRQWQA